MSAMAILKATKLNPEARARLQGMLLQLKKAEAYLQDGGSAESRERGAHHLNSTVRELSSWLQVLDYNDEVRRRQRCGL